MSTATRVIPTTLTVREIAALIDHSLLRPKLTDDDVCNGCALAGQYGTWSVCVKPADVALAVQRLTDGRWLPPRELDDGEQALRDPPSA
jgi:hypothetical protein